LYFTKKYRSIKRYSKGKKAFEQANNIQEQDAQDISAYFDDFRREAVASNEQIQQMAQSFKGAANTMSEVMDRLKTAMATISTQEKTIANLTNTNKQLIENNSKLAAALAAGGGKVVKETSVVKKEEKAGGTTVGDEDEVKKTNPQGHKCAICYQICVRVLCTVCASVQI
jgi:GTP1/Obg family GTP-binding protein